MGKIIRRCLTAAVLMIVVGFILVIGITAVKGQDYLNQIFSRITGDRVEEVTDWLSQWDGEGGYEIEDSMHFDQEHHTAEEDVNESFQDIHSLKLEVGGCSFYLTASGDDAFHVRSENVGKIQVYEKNGKLHLTAVRKTGIDISASTVYLQVPAGAALEEVSLEVGAGEASLEALSAREVELEMGAGRIVADQIQTDELSVSVGAGEARLEEMNVGELKAEVGVGSFQGQGMIREKAKLECAMGNLELALDCQETDFDYELECAAGSIRLGDSQFKTLSTEKKIDNHASRKMELECSMGSIHVEFNGK